MHTKTVPEDKEFASNESATHTSGIWILLSFQTRKAQGLLGIERKKDWTHYFVRSVHLMGPHLLPKKVGFKKKKKD